MPVMVSGFEQFEVEWVDPRSLVPWEANPRTISERARRKLRETLESVGWEDVLVARREDRGMIGGHQRLSVALELLDEGDERFAEVPVIFLEGYSDQQAAAAAVRLNNPDLQGRFDAALLADVIAALDDPTETGYDEDDLEAIRRAHADAPVVPPDSFRRVDDDLPTQYRCPSCRYEWSGDPKPTEAGAG